MKTPLAKTILLLAVLWACLPSSRAVVATHGALLIDMSGSMKGNDPEDLRWDGLLTMVRLLELSRKNHLGVWYFTSGDLKKIGLTPVNAQTYPLFEAIKNDRPRDGGTDLVPALAAAIGELTTRQGTRYVVVLSDGEFSRDDDIRRLAKDFAGSGGLIFYVCVTRQRGLTSRGIAEACAITGGKQFVIDTNRRVDVLAPEILRTFLDIFVRVAPPTAAVLTGRDGTFVLDRSHRSFIALAPNVRRISVVAPDGTARGMADAMGGQAQNIEFQKWDLTVLKRPVGTTSLKTWDDGRWTVRDQLTALPVEGAHIYIHGDVELVDVPASGFQFATGTQNSVQVGLAADALPEWCPTPDASAYLRPVTGRLLVRAGDRTLASAALENTGGKLRGNVQWTAAAGRYVATLEARSAAGSLISRVDNLPVHVESDLYAVELAVREGPQAPWRPVEFDATTQTQKTAIATESFAQFRLTLKTPVASAANRDTRVERIVDDVVLVLEPGQGGPIRQKLVRLQGMGPTTYAGELRLASPDVYRAKVEISGQLRYQGEVVIGTAPPVREEPLRDTVALPPFQVEGGDITVEWRATGEPGRSAGCDEVLTFAGQIKIRDVPQRTRDLIALLQANALAFEVQGPKGIHDSKAGSAHFESLQITETADGVGFSGVYLGVTEQGRYALRPQITKPGPRGETLALRGPSLVWNVGEAFARLAVARSEAGASTTIAESACGMGAQREPADPSQPLIAKLAPTGPASGQPRLAEPPVLTLVDTKSGHRRPLVATVNGGEATVELRELEANVAYRIEARAKFMGQIDVRHTVPLSLRPPPPPPKPGVQIEWNPGTANFIGAGGGRSFGADQVVPFEGRVKITGAPALIDAMTRSFIASGLMLLFESSGGGRSGQSDPKWWRNTAIAPAPGGVTFKGEYIGPKQPGTHQLRVALKHDGAEVPAANDTLTVGVVEPLLAVTINAQRDGKVKREVFSGNGDTATGLFDDQKLEFALRLAEAQRYPGLNAYPYCKVSLVSAGLEKVVLPHADSLNPNVDLKKLPAGTHELRISVRLNAGTEVNRTIALVVKRAAVAGGIGVDFARPLNPNYWLHEVVPIEADIRFADGNAGDWEDWGADLAAFVIATPTGGTAPQKIPLTPPASRGGRFVATGNLPSGRKGPHQVVVEIAAKSDGRSLARTAAHGCSFDPAVVFTITQEARVHDSAAEPGAGALLLRADQRVRFGATIQPAVDPSGVGVPKVTVSRVGQTPAVSDLQRASGHFALDQPPLGRGTLTITFETGIVQELGREPRRLRHDVQFEGATPRWPWIVLGMLCVAAAAWFLPGLRSLADPKLPPLQGDVTVMHPEAGAPHPFRIPASVSEEILTRIRNRGRAARTLVVSAGGRFPLPADLNLEGARLVFTLRVNPRTKQPEFVVRRTPSALGEQLAVMQDGVLPLFEGTEEMTANPAELLMPLVVSSEGSGLALMHLRFEFAQITQPNAAVTQP